MPLVSQLASRNPRSGPVASRQAGLVLHWIHDHDRVHECRQGSPRPEADRRTPAEPGHPAPTGTRVRRRTGSGSPPGSSAVPQAADPASICVDASQKPPLRLRITPGVRLEPPALDGLHQRCHVALLAGLFERRIQILVVPLEDLAIGVGGQHGPDRRRRTCRARQNLCTVAPQRADPLETLGIIRPDRCRAGVGATSPDQYGPSMLC
jgi:hypothetical protein